MGLSTKRGSRAAFGAILLGASFLVACEGTGKGQGGYPYKGGSEEGNPEYYGSFEDFQDRRPSVFGTGGISFGGPDKPRGDGGGGIGVNSFLWRASLDTVSVWPVNSADPFGGVIITDWHSPAYPAERFKLNVYIMGRSLRADGVRVGVFRQVQDTGGTWRDAPLPSATATTIENAILTKARQLRNENFQR